MFRSNALARLNNSSEEMVVKLLAKLLRLTVPTVVLMSLFIKLAEAFWVLKRVMPWRTWPITLVLASLYK